LAHKNTIESTWWHVRAFLNPYNRTGDYNYHPAHCMFAAGCHSENVDQFTKFIGYLAVAPIHKSGQPHSHI
jgi:hypothetical protein